MSEFNGETDLHRDVKFLDQIVNDLDDAARHYKTDFNENGPDWFQETVEADLIALAIINKARANLSTLQRDLENVVAQSMSSKKVEIEGAGEFERSKKKDRTQWHKDGLLPDVLDSRMFDRHSGELIEETPLDKVLAVWNLPAPRLTALRDRGLDPDEYCHTEDAGWTIRYPS